MSSQECEYLKRLMDEDPARFMKVCLKAYREEFKYKLSKLEERHQRVMANLKTISERHEKDYKRLATTSSRNWNLKSHSSSNDQNTTLDEVHKKIGKNKIM